jgi:hypothetical protein
VKLSEMSSDQLVKKHTAIEKILVKRGNAPAFRQILASHAAAVLPRMLSREQKILLQRILDNASEMAHVCGDELEGFVPEGTDPQEAVINLDEELGSMNLLAYPESPDKDG